MQTQIWKRKRLDIHKKFMNKLSDICSMCRAARRNFHGNHLFREEIPPLPPPHLCLRHRVRLVALTIPKMTRLNWVNFDKLSLNLKLSKIYISIVYYQAFWVVKLLFESKLWYTYSYFCGLKHSKSDCFLCQNTEVKFLVPMQRSYNTNVVLSISDFHQKYI